ncbi:MAG: hypothetical protein NT154_45540 [Verrucomicrobia bacterium]|nr:hypothetical protein [Verrucomicrobiota bacterium]
MFVVSGSAAAEMTVDFSQTNGVIRPLHGVNLGPLCYRGMVDLSAYHRELGVPLTRLHDVVWVNYDAVDISTIFREFRNDPALPESYEFAATDDYIAAVVKTGSAVLYRLGESIEHTPRKYRVHPPRDFGKWADICCGIIRHYNEGWADGFRYNIRYWEVWNEPENQPAMWTGTDDQYFQLYERTAKAIKARWPDLKVGGPSLGYTGEFKEGQFQAGDFLLRFLRHCRDHHVPMDFFSWHRYANDPSDYARRARALRQVLDEHGFRQTESHFNEWNYLPNEDWRPMMKEGQGLMREQWSAEMGGPKGAAFAAWALISLQDAPVDAANFYTAEVQMFGMFSLNGVPRKNFYAFKAFRTLLDTPRRVKTPPCEAGRIAVCAGLNSENTRAAILLSNFNTADGATDLVVRGLPWSAPTGFELYLVDGSHDFQLARRAALGTDSRLTLAELKAPGVALLKLLQLPGQ